MFAELLNTCPVYIRPEHNLQILTQVAWSAAVFDRLLSLVGRLPLQQALSIAAQQLHSAESGNKNFSGRKWLLRPITRHKFNEVPENYRMK